MVKIKVKPHIRKRKRVRGYSRKKRPKGKKRIKVKPLFVKIERYTDEYGQIRPERKWTVIKKKNV